MNPPALTHPLQNTFEYVFEDLKTVGIPHTTFEEMHQRAAGLPDLGQKFILEYRLEEGNDQVDFQPPVKFGGDIHHRLANPQSDPQVQKAVNNSPAWQRISELAQAWLNKNSKTHLWSTLIYLEFDVVDSKDTIAVPSAFISLDSWMVDRNKDMGLEQSHPELGAMFEAWEIIFKRKTPQLFQHRLRSCFELLPTHARPLFFGMMCGREEASSRVGFSLPIGSVVPYLNAIGYHEDLEPLGKILEELEAFLSPALYSFFRVAIDINHSGEHALQPRICLEVPSQTEAQRSQFIDYLEARGLCAPEKRPDRLNNVPSLEYHYTKVAYQNGKLFQAKSYFLANWPKDRD